MTSAATPKPNAMGKPITIDTNKMARKIHSMVITPLAIQPTGRVVEQ